jgi:hypothetical protein
MVLAQQQAPPKPTNLYFVIEASSLLMCCITQPPAQLYCQATLAHFTSAYYSAGHRQGQAFADSQTCDELNAPKG